MLALGRKYKSKGLETIAVSLDIPTDAEARQRMEEFLTRQKADCRCRLLVEEVPYWQKKLKTDGPPCLFLFDPQGRLVGRWAGAEIDFAKLDKLIEETLTP